MHKPKKGAISIMQDVDESCRARIDTQETRIDLPEISSLERNCDSDFSESGKDPYQARIGTFI